MSHMPMRIVRGESAEDVLAVTRGLKALHYLLLSTMGMLSPQIKQSKGERCAWGVCDRRGVAAIKVANEWIAYLCPNHYDRVMDEQPHPHVFRQTALQPAEDVDGV